MIFFFAQVLLGFMLPTALLSMWISNTASTAMMVNMVMMMVKMTTTTMMKRHLQSYNRFRYWRQSWLSWAQNTGSCLRTSIEKYHSVYGDWSTNRKMLLLGIAYAANIGGTGTLIGTPPNLVSFGFLISVRYTMHTSLGTPPNLVGVNSDVNCYT